MQGVMMTSFASVARPLSVTFERLLRTLVTAVDRLIGHVSGTAPWGGGRFPSRRLRPTRPRPPGPGAAPYRTTDLDQAGAVWWPLVRVGGRPVVRHPRATG